MTLRIRKRDKALAEFMAVMLDKADGGLEAMGQAVSLPFMLASLPFPYPGCERADAARCVYRAVNRLPNGNDLTLTVEVERPEDMPTGAWAHRIWEGVWGHGFSLARLKRHELLKGGDALDACLLRCDTTLKAWMAQYVEASAINGEEMAEARKQISQVLKATITLRETKPHAQHHYLHGYPAGCGSLPDSSRLAREIRVFEPEQRGSQFFETGIRITPAMALWLRHQKGMTFFWRQLRAFDRYPMLRGLVTSLMARMGRGERDLHKRIPLHRLAAQFGLTVKRVQVLLEALLPKLQVAMPGLRASVERSRVTGALAMRVYHAPDRLLSEEEHDLLTWQGRWHLWPRVYRPVARAA